ncbi:MAG: hypothetical protein AB7T49_21380 [Oligoflexales bacterium]
MAYRTYDHRIKHLIARSGNPDLFWELKIPRSTTLTWIRNGVRDVVTAKELNDDHEKLLIENRQLRRQIEASQAVQHLSISTFRLFGLQIQFKRLPTAEAKTDLIGKIKAAANVCGLATALEAIGLSSQRYHVWLKRQKRCNLQDQPSCPKLTPWKLPIAEISKIKNYVTSNDYAHISVPSLVWLARRTGDVFASAATWYRIIKQYQLKKPLLRIYPDKPTVGIRASRRTRFGTLTKPSFGFRTGRKFSFKALLITSLG